jgi:hypothetical protein
MGARTPDGHPPKANTCCREFQLLGEQGSQGAAADVGIGRAGAFLSPSGPTLYQQRCSERREADLTGTAEGSSLVDVTNRLSLDIIAGTIRNWAGRMPHSDLSAEDLTSLMTFLADHRRVRRVCAAR